MSRILAIDYGAKRTGIAVSDPLKLIASGLDTVPTQDLLDFLANYFKEETVETIVVGLPTHPDGNPTNITHLVIGFIRKVKKLYPTIEVVTVDEHFTSAEAKDIILRSGAKKKKRQDKSLVDKVSAILILQSYMETL